MVVSLSYVTVMEQKTSQKTKSSIGAFYGAESGIEWALNKIATSTGTTIIDTFGSQWQSGQKLVNCPASFGTDTCKIYLLDKDGDVIESSSANLSEIKAVRSVGFEAQGTKRAIEAAVPVSAVSTPP